MTMNHPWYNPPITQPTARIFIIPELLESILLNLDMHTLLISTRVSHLWNNLIKTSPRLQTALFLLPQSTATASSQPRTKNPLLLDIIWPQFIARMLKTRPRPAYIGAWFPDIISTEKEEAYLRPEASWRRMFLHQPPTSRASFIVGPDIKKGPLHSYIKCGCHEGLIRLQDLEYLIDSGAIVPESPYPFVFGTRGHDFWFQEHAFPGNSRMGIDKQLGMSEFIVVSLEGTFDEWVEKKNNPRLRRSKVQRLWSKETKREQNRVERVLRRLRWEKEFRWYREHDMLDLSAERFGLTYVSEDDSSDDSSDEDSEDSEDESLSFEP
ncbi:uncharacterized protein BO80DRAFT_476998 [Aspergillus ibericus CBS 121593]|uniref:F-box domain-containing protein n=1 Tax=Aspergillus ibericus CBS 121593 TaxID=1448316 RepID=A0A395GX91_9EURO|nr:hypothetical protein BO80DRAFT_476998 [Aspergillus ibericus CBS 121593]RAK99969.1 hypothetical protein BO80DRAFT_476998 [Aspergillus ibericus CBS 121593]